MQPVHVNNPGGFDRIRRDVKSRPQGRLSPVPTIATVMIRADIATAALNEQVEQRIRIAASLLPAYRIGAKVRPWDGTRCGLLITDLSDAYGRQAFALAKKRGTPILAISDNPTDIETECVIVSENSPAPVLAQHLRELLTRDLPAESATVADVNDSFPALCRLAAPQYRGRPVDATCNGRTIHIRPVEGRVYANTLSDLLSACDSFSSSAWELQIASASDRATTADGASRSLEAFLLQTAFQGRDQLPSFPAGRYQLNDWPDVGTAPELIGALKVARSLLRAPASERELRLACDVSEEEVKASLWAYQASNLLFSSDNSGDAIRSTPAPTARFSGILGRIANRFGLGRH